MLRRSELKRGKPLLRRPKRRKSPRNTGPIRSIRNLVWERDEGRCAVCGLGVAGQVHSLQHRRSRGPGGTRWPQINSPANLLLVHGDGTTGCHGWIEDSPIEAKSAGYAISRLTDVDPATIPVAHAVHGWVYLLDDGTVMDALDEGGAA
jgi:hypothetical protein